jgi:hypothetical protein
MATIMRRDGSGTYSDGRWRLKAYTDKDGVRHPEFALTTRQMSKAMGISIPKNGRLSEPYWRQFLAERNELHAKQRGTKSPLQKQIASLEEIIAEFKADGRDTASLHKELTEAREVEPTPYINFDHRFERPAVHPDIRDIANKIQSSGSVLTATTIETLNSLVPRRKPNAVPQSESLRHEARIWIDGMKKTGAKNSWLAPARHIEFFLEVCGDISIRNITGDHWREFCSRVDALTVHGNGIKPISDPYRYNYRSNVIQFLKNLEALKTNLNLNYAFVRLFPVVKGEGKKVQFSLDQMKTALAHSEGVVRTMVLCGLNMGFYQGDVLALSEDKIGADGLTTYRAKCLKKNAKNPLQMTWWLWNETRCNLRFDLTAADLKAFEAFRQEHGLPQFKALRKGAAQWLNDNFGGEVAKAFRCDAGSGCQDKFYIRQASPATIKNLKKALIKFGAALGIS